MTPYEIELLIFINGRASSLDECAPPCTHRDNVVARFEHDDLIYENQESTSGWYTTSRGMALVEMLCATPLPKRVWVDPRTEKAIGDI